MALGMAAFGLSAAEHHGVVKANGQPLPGATVTATLDAKTLTTSTDDQGNYSFADLPDGVWTIKVQMLGFSTMSRDVGVTADAPSPTWDLKLQSAADVKAAINAIEAAKKAAAPAPTAAPTPAAPTAPATAATPTTSAANTPKPTAATPAQAAPGRGANSAANTGGRNGRGGNSTPSLRQAVANAQNGGGFNRLDVNSTGAADNSNFGPDVQAGGDLAQSSNDAVVLMGSSSDALGMPQQNDWFGGRGMGDMGGGFGGPGGPGGFGDPNNPGGDPNAAGAGGGRGGRGGGGAPGGGGGMMAGGGPGGFGGGRGMMPGGAGGRGGRGGPGGPGGRGGRGNTNSFGNGRRAQRSLYNGNINFNADTSIWDAQQFSTTGAQTEKPDYTRFTAGFTFGGPIAIPHLFSDRAHNGTFTITYNLNRSTNAANTYGTVPTAAERTGDFSSAVSPSTGLPIVIYDPTTGSPFPGNMIPSNRLNSAAISLLKFYPAPLASIINGKYNYQIGTTSETNTDNVNIRLNHTINAKNQLSGGLGFQRSNGNNAGNIFQFLDANTGSGINANVGWTYRFTPTFFNTLRFTFSRSTSNATPYFAGLGVNVAAELGITGTDQNPLYWGPPSLSFSNFTGLSDGSPSENRNQTAAIAESVQRIRGTHTITTGADLRMQQFNPISQSNARGSMVFNGTLTTVPGATSALGSGFDLADFLLGVPDTSSVAYGNADKYFRTNWWDVYLDDDWRATTKLSFRGGIRWDYSEPFTEKYGRLTDLYTAPYFTAATPVCSESFSNCQGASASNLPSSLLRPDKRGVAPTFGFALKPWIKHSTTIRGGYGLYWNTSFYQSIAQQMSQQSPLSNSYSISNTSIPLTIQTAFPSAALVASTGTVTNTFAVDPGFKNGYAQSWQLAIQQNLKASLVMTGTYTGTKGTGLPQEFVPNTFPVGAPVSPYPKGYIYETSGGNSSFNSGTIQMQRRMHNGFGGNVSYTYSKLISDGMLGGRGGSSSTAQNWLDLAAERSVDSSNQTHRLTGSWQFSSGQGLHAAALLKGWRATVLKDWTVTNNVTVGSGRPETPLVTSSVRGTGITATTRPELVAPLYPATPGYAFNLNALTSAPSGEWGNAGRGIILGPNTFSYNASAGRVFRIGERKSLDIRFDGTNILNHVVFGSYNVTVGSNQFGLVQSPGQMRSFRANVRFSFR